MARLNPVQKVFKSQRAVAQAGDLVTVRVGDVGLGNPELMKRLVDTGVESGHWIVHRHPLGTYHCHLTEKGANVLSSGE